MAYGWDQTVSAPGGASFNAPLLNFSQIANWFKDFQQGQQGEQQRQLNDQSLATGQQQQQLNDQRIAAGQRQQALASAFPNGLPTDPRTGQVDYSQVAATLAKFGDVGDAVTLMQSQPAPLSPMLGGQQAGGAFANPGGGVPAAGPTPATVQAKPLPAPASNSPKGDSGDNTVTSLVTDKLPAQNQTTGQTIIKVAEVMGIDPNANLTPGQVRRAQGLIQKYAPDIAGPASGGGGSNLPPSANAGTPAPGAGGAAQPNAQPPQSGGPITPRVPLPQGFTDPQQAILALRREAARLSASPKSQGQVAELNNWAERIEASVAPQKVGNYDTYIDPQTGKVLYQGAGANALRNGAGASTSLEADAENYRQTGKLPPNMGRGVQGQAEAQRIRERAVEIEAEEGGDIKDWPSRWQNFATQATGKRVLQQRATNLALAENEANALIPRVREISDKIDRTQYPSLNKLIMAAEQGSGDPNVIKYGLAVASLVPVYARVLKPTGQITEGDTHRALEILDKAWSKGQVNAALDQMEVELKSAKGALQKTIDESSGRKSDASSGKSDSSSSTPKGKWINLPNGARIQEVAQ